MPGGLDQTKRKVSKRKFFIPKAKANKVKNFASFVFYIQDFSQAIPLSLSVAQNQKKSTSLIETQDDLIFYVNEC